MNHYMFLEKSLEDDNFFVMVAAKNPADAVYKAAKELYIHDEFFIEYISQRSINMSFAEKFWLLDTDDNEFDEDDECRWCDEKLFEERVKDYFKNYPDLAEKFINYFFSEDDEYKTQLMLEDFIQNAEDFLIKEYLKFIDYKLIDLSEIKRLE